MEEFEKSMVLCQQLAAAVNEAEDAVEAVEGASDRKKRQAQRALSLAEMNFESAKMLQKEMIGAKGSASSKSPPNSPARCR
jgi:cellobiose-specific phosphotransferase system component IIA